MDEKSYFKEMNLKRQQKFANDQPPWQIPGQLHREKALWRIEEWKYAGSVISMKRALFVSLPHQHTVPAFYQIKDDHEKPSHVF